MTESPKIRILYEDKWIVLCIKPVGILSEEAGMPALLSRQCGGKFFCVHRLDQQVGGVMVYARDGKTAARLSESFAKHDTVKQYLAAAEGIPEAEEGEMHDLLFHDRSKNKTYIVNRERKGVKAADLHWKALQTIHLQNGAAALYLITLGSGRSHQIRVQFASRKHPLIGDGRYGSHLNAPAPALWSCSLTLPHPVTGETLHYTALPDSQAPWHEFQLDSLTL